MNQRAQILWLLITGLVCTLLVANNASAVITSKHGPKNDYNITINYELGMHCTGFDFSYCCILPPYNSIQSQVIKTAKGPYDFPQLLKQTLKIQQC